MDVIDLIQDDATLKGLEILLQHAFEIDENDLPSIDAIGNLQRQRSGNPNDKSVEGTVLLSHAYHGIMNVGIPTVAGYLREGIFPYQMLNRSSGEMQKKPAKMILSGEWGMIEQSQYSHIANQEFGKSVWHFRRLIDSARHHLVDTKEGASIVHNMSHMLMVIEPLYAAAVRSYDPEKTKRIYAESAEVVPAK